MTGEAGMIVEDDGSDDGEACGRVEGPEENPCQHPFFFFSCFEVSEDDGLVDGWDEKER